MKQEIKINGIIYQLIEQTGEELNELGSCSGCIAKGNESLCNKLGQCWSENKNYIICILF